MPPHSGHLRRLLVVGRHGLRVGRRGDKGARKQRSHPGARANHGPVGCKMKRAAGTRQQQPTRPEQPCTVLCGRSGRHSLFRVLAADHQPAAAADLAAPLDELAVEGRAGGIGRRRLLMRFQGRSPLGSRKGDSSGTKHQIVARPAARGRLLHQPEQTNCKRQRSLKQQAACVHQHRQGGNHSRCAW
jgi:hypothetical protein